MDKLSYLSLAPHLRNLRYSGFYQLSLESKRVHRVIHGYYMKLVLSLILLYTVQQIMKVYQVRDNADKVMDTMFLLLTNSDSIYKQVVLWKKASNIEELLNIMKGPIFNNEAKEHQLILSQTVTQARLLLKTFNSVAILTCLLWVLYPIILFVQRKPVEFAIWLPFDANASPHFYGVALYVWIQTSWLAFNNTTMDAFISFFLAQAKTQLSILRRSLEQSMAKSKEIAKLESKPFVEVHHEEFRKLLIHYNEIIRFSKLLQNIFGGALLYQFLVSGWIICTTVYRTLNVNPASVEFVSMVMYMLCMIVELFLFCYYGNEVHCESSCLTESVYMMDWLNLPTKHRKKIIIFMERTKQPITLMAGPFIPLSNSTFVSILRSSYSFYTVLKNTDE